MAFDLASAQLVDDTADFDPASAQPVEFDPASAEPLTNEVIIRDPLADNALAPRAAFMPTARSTVTGLTPNEAQARGEAGGVALSDAVKGAPDAIVEGVIRAAPPVAGALLTAPLGPLASAGGFGIGLGAGDALAQGYRMMRGLQEDFNQAATITQTLTGAAGGLLAPIMPVATPANPTALAFLQSLAKPAAANALTSAGISMAVQKGTTGRIDPAQTAFDTVLGTGTGLLFAAAQAGTITRAQRDYLGDLAYRQGFRGQTDAEFRAWLQAEAAKRTPAPVNVTPSRPPGIANQPAAPAAVAPTAPVAPTRAPTPAAAVPARLPVTAAQLRAVTRAERTGFIGSLSDEQLAGLTQQYTARPAAAPAGALPVAGNVSDPTPPAPSASTFDELSTLWQDAGIKLALTPAKAGVARVSALEVPEGQRGQGLGSFILKDIREVADLTGQIVEFPAPTGPDAARQTAWLEREGWEPYGRKTADGAIAYRYAPDSRPKGPRPSFGPRADGTVDLIDFIGQLGGAPKRPANAAGRGEWDGWSEAFQGRARMLVSTRNGGIDTFIQELNEIGGFQFESPDDFYNAVGVALETRKRVKTAVEAEVNTAKFMDAALNNKGRAPGERTDNPVGVDTLYPGDTFKVKGEDFRVRDVTEDGNVIVQDGPRFGTQQLPAGQLLYPDKGGITPGQRGTGEFNPADELTPVDSAPNDAEFMPSRQVTTLEEARQVARSFVNRPLTNQGDGRVATVSGASLDKMLSQSAVKKSAGTAAHAQAVANVDELYQRARLTESKPDRANDPNITGIHRYTTAILHDGRPLEVKITVKELTNPSGNRVYTIEALDLGNAKPAGQLVDDAGANLPEERATPLAGSENTVPPSGDKVNPPRTSGSTNASPGSPSAEAYPADSFRANPADDPTVSQLPAELPEAIQFYRQLSGGQYPKIREKIRVLHGTALGVFRHNDSAGTHSLELRADLFQLVSPAEKNQLAAQALTWANLMRATGSTVPLDELASARFNELLRAAEQKALTENPRQALAVMWHEIGHLVDWLPDNTLKRGNILGHIAGFKRHLKGFIAENPGISPVPEPPTASERAKLQRQAERELRAQVIETVEIIRREEPIYRELPITADHITSILKTAQRDDFPQLYDWFAKLERAEKASVLRSAMKGIVDARASAFNRREDTGQTRTVEETITRKTGVEPTPEDIRARFDELLREEFKRRGLISQREIRAETDAVIKWWQGVDEVPAYFKTAIETWAEVFSAMMNNPAGVAKRAPTFWRAFNAYLVNRPEVAKAYRAMQDSIKSGAIHRERVQNLRESWHRDEDNSVLADSMFGSYDMAHIRDTVSILFNRQTGPIQRRALDVLKKDPNNRVATNALSALKNYLYRATGWEAYARDLNLHVEGPLAAASLHHDDLSEFLFHSRIAGGDRQQLANPLGWSPKTSGERLAAMEADLGTDRFAALQEAAGTFRAIYEEQVIPLLKEANIVSPELMQIIEDRTLYATFAKAREFNPLEAGTLQGALENAYGKDVTARIYRQIGTLGEIRSPYLATVQKAFSLISTARRQIALKSVVAYLEEFEPQNIIPAQVRFTDGRMEPVPMETRQVGTLYTLNAGKVEAFYVPRVITEMMSFGSPLESQIVGLAHKTLAWPKAILTELNPGFWPVAFFKDVGTMAIQLPKGMSAIRQIPAGWTAARASMTSQPSPLADAALRRLMVISRADSRGEHLGNADELTRILMRMGQEPKLWDAEAEKIGRVLRFWMAWKRQGQTLERAIKFASMQHLDLTFPNMPEWEKKRMVNEQGGSPDFLEKGRAAPVVDLWMMFYNPWLRGLEAMKTSAGKDPRGFWTKFIGTVGLASTAYWMFEQGMLDGGLSPEEAEDKRDMMRSIPERDKRRGFAIPLGWSDRDQGKVTYIVLPFPDSLRYLHTGQRTMLQAMGKGGTAEGGFSDFLSYQGQDLPGTNPMLKEAGKWYDYHVLGRNPYDSFLGRGALPEDMVTAGTAGGELALQSLSNVTGGIVYRHRQDRPGETPTEMESFLKTPIVGNMIGRWLRVSNRGLTEEAERDVKAVRQREAELRLVGEEMVGRQMRGEPWSAAQETLYVEEPYLQQRVIDRQITIMSQATDPEMKAWQNAKSTGEKQALMEAWLKRSEEKEKRLKTP